MANPRHARADLARGFDNGGAAAWTAVKAGRDGGEGVTIGSGGAKALVSRDEALESFGCAIKVRALRQGPLHTQAFTAQVPSTRMIRSSCIADRRALDMRNV